MDLNSDYPTILRDPEHDDIAYVSFPNRVGVLRGETKNGKFYPSEISFRTDLSVNEQKILSDKMGAESGLFFDE